MNLASSYSFCRNHTFPVITDNDVKLAHLSRTVILSSAFLAQEQGLSTWEAVTLGKEHDDSLSAETYVSPAKT